MVISILKRITRGILFLFLFLFLLFWFLSEFKYDQFERYYQELTGDSDSSRFPSLQKKSILFDNYLCYLKGIKSKEQQCSDNTNIALNKIKKGEYNVYLGKIDSIRKYEKKKTFVDLKIVGINAYKRGYAFVTKKSSTLFIPNKNTNVIYRYLVWVDEILKGNWGLTENNTRKIKSEIAFALPNTILLITYSSALILILSLAFSFFLTSNLAEILKKPIAYLLELLSSTPEFLLCFALLYLFYFYPLKKNIIPIYDGYDDFFLIPFRFSGKYILNFLLYFSLPALVLSLANGNITVLTKYLTEQINSYRRGDNFRFFKSIGMKNVYINFVFILKESLPIVITYLTMKIPLIIGAAVIVEKIFDLNGIGNMAFKYFNKGDCGVILTVFLFIFVITFVFDTIANALNYIICPMKRR